MEPKTYTLATLLAICGKQGLKQTLPWHDLKDGGLWLAGREPLISDGEWEVMQWHPRKNLNLPALPVPFMACELAAFMLDGGGLYLFERFDFDALDADSLSRAGSDPGTTVALSEDYRDALRDAAIDAPGLLDDALRSLGENADEAREVLREALHLRRLAAAMFERTADGVRKSADWLLKEEPQDQIGPTLAGAAGGAEADRGRRLKRRALIDALRRRWPTVERDLRDGADNGLSNVARGESVGWWWEGAALAWAEQRGKLIAATAAAPVWPGATVHRLKD